MKPETVTTGSVESISFVRELVKQIIVRDGYPVVRVVDESLVGAFHGYAPESVLRHVSPVEREMMLKMNAIIRIHAPTHIKPLSGINPEKLKTRSIATRELIEVFLRGVLSGGSSGL